MAKAVFRYVVLAVVLALVVLFAVYVWPTRYKYDHMSATRTGAGRDIIRIDRFTGKAEVLLYKGWTPLQPEY